MLHFRSLLLTATVGLVASLSSCSSARHFDFTTTSSRTSAYHAAPAVAVSATTPVSAAEAPALIDPTLTASAAQVAEPVAAPANTVVARPPAPAALRLSEQLQAARAERQLSRAQERRYERVLSRVKHAETRRAAAGQTQAVDALELILAIFLPPIGVLLHEDGLTTKFWISLILTFLFFFPGMIYSILVVLDKV